MAEKGKAEWRTIALPSGIVDMVDRLAEFPQLGLTSRNAFILKAVDAQVAASIQQLLDMQRLGLLQGDDLERLKAWKRKN